MPKAIKGKSGCVGGGPKEMLLVASKVKTLIKDAGCNTAGDALDGLNNYVYWLVQTAATRAAANGRTTVRAHDFHIGREGSLPIGGSRAPHGAPAFVSVWPLLSYTYGR